jgi:hypothetical protein
VSEAVTGESERWRLTQRLRRALLKRESPRVQMGFLVGVAGGAGFLASVVLLRLGLERIPARYVLSVAFAYAVLLALLYFWILHRRRRAADNDAASHWADLDPAVALDLADSVPRSVPGFTGGGGRFGGGGATSSWSSADAPVASGGGGEGGSGGGGFSLDLDDGWILVVLAAAAAILVGASIWIVALAPSLFAELLLDGVLSASLYRRLRRLPQRSWLETAVRRTILPFVLAAITLGALGMAMERYAPEARSLGGVLAHRNR